MVWEKYGVRLEPEQRDRLEHVVRAGKSSARVTTRARILLKGGVPFLHQGLGFPPQHILVGEPLPQAAAGQYAELNLGHVQPTAVLWRVVKLQPTCNPPGLGGGESFVQGRHPVGIQAGLVQDHPHARDLPSRLHLPAAAHLMGEVLHRAPLGHRIPPAANLSPRQRRIAQARNRLRVPSRRYS